VVEGRALEHGEHRAHGQREVGAGVAVWHWEHVDAVQVFLALQQPMNAGTQRAT